MVKFTVDYNVIAIILIFGSVQTVLALFLWYDLLKNLNIQIGPILGYLDPVFAIIFALLLLNQVSSPYTIIGDLLLIGSEMIITESTIKKYDMKSSGIINGGIIRSYTM